MNYTCGLFDSFEDYLMFATLMYAMFVYTILVQAYVTAC